MNSNEPITLTRDVEGTVIPAGTKVTLQKGEQAFITQSLGGTYTVIVKGNMFRIEAKDADALGLEVAAKAVSTGTPSTAEQIDKEAWNQMRTCYDPEIPVNIVDLGLVYDCHVEPLGAPDRYKVGVKLTLTAPGCGMGPVIAEDARARIAALPGVARAKVHIVWDPVWTPQMISDEGRKVLGLE
jgi:probable FeS assembly SUF system protein SufT